MAPERDGRGADAAPRTVARDGEHAIEVRRSRFVCAVARVDGEERAQAFVREVRRRHWNASHNCSAYVVDGGRVHRSSDDGEPAGTAGVPMLEVLLRRGLDGTAAVVTRYFGGVKLGAGGLVRAYGAAVSAALDAVGLVERRPHLLVTAEADHVLAGRLENDLRTAGHAVRDVRYGERVAIDVAVPEPDAAAFTAWLAQTTGGAARVRTAGRVWVEVPV